MYKYDTWTVCVHHERKSLHVYDRHFVHVSFTSIAHMLYMYIMHTRYTYVIHMSFSYEYVHIIPHTHKSKRVNSQRIQDVPQLINKKPTRNTKQNHMPIKKKVAEGHLPKYNACPPTTKLSHNTRHAPIDRQEASTEHNAKPHAY